MVVYVWVIRDGGTGALEYGKLSNQPQKAPPALDDCGVRGAAKFAQIGKDASLKMLNAVVDTWWPFFKCRLDMGVFKSQCKF